MPFQFRTFPTFQTERLSLEAINSTDVEFIFNGLSHPEVIPYYGVSFKTLEETQSQMEWYTNLWKTQEGLWWKMRNRTTDELIGAIGFNNHSKKSRNAEVGFWLLPEAWGQGFATEAFERVLNFAFQDWNLHRVYAEVERENLASLKLLLKLDFKQEGHFRECEWKNGRFIDLLLFARLKSY